MNKGFMIFLSFVAGGAAGFMAANNLLRDKYNKKADEEIRSVVESFRKECKTIRKKEAASEQAPESERRRYGRYAAKLGYTDEKAPAPILTPYVISPDDYGEEAEYEQISLTCYADGTVADDSDRPMSDDDIQATIGKESLKHFGEYEDDSVFVRNDQLKVDYEILLDHRTYADILSEKPYLTR